MYVDLSEADLDLPLRRGISGDDLFVLPLDHLAFVNKGGPVDGRRTDLSPELDFVPFNAHIAPRVVQL